MADLPTDRTVGVVGAGTMGAGVAQLALTAGHPVQLHDVDADRRQGARAEIEQRLTRNVEKQRMSAEARDAALARLEIADDLDRLGEAALVVEAVAERLEVKRQVFGRLAEVCAGDAILASNTSSLSITAIAAGLPRPERIAGMHFFNPAPLMPLVEVVRGVATGAEVVDTLVATAEAWGKTPVIAQSTPGFIVNRVARPYYAEALRLLDERAADAATIDAVLKEAGGFRMGPFELMDLIGVEVNLAVTTSVYELMGHDPRYRPSRSQTALAEAGWHGRKAGRGFHDYRDGAPAAAPDTQPERPAPAAVEAVGATDLPAALLDRIRDAGVELREAEAGAAGLPAHLALPSGGVLMATDGDLATAHAARSGREVVLFDLARDYAATPRLALAAADQAGPATWAEAVGLLQAAGIAVSRVDDVPGLVLARTVAMLASEAADTVHQGVAAPEAVDTAMQKGTSYPLGPLAWADALGLRRVCALLDNMAAIHGDGRHRVSPLLRRRALTGGRLR
jgi:3-hydroxybutyryl-CoA dehydrogenase